MLTNFSIELPAPLTYVSVLIVRNIKTRRSCWYWNAKFAHRNVLFVYPIWVAGVRSRVCLRPDSALKRTSLPLVQSTERALSRRPLTGGFEVVARSSTHATIFRTGFGYVVRCTTMMMVTMMSINHFRRSATNATFNAVKIRRNK